MDIETLRAFCLSLPKATEDVKWGADLCFSIGGKMFCVTGMEGPFSASIKANDEQFEELIDKPGIVPAPYLARNKWVLITDAHTLDDTELKALIAQSYQLIKNKLPKKVQKEING